MTDRKISLSFNVDKIDALFSDVDQSFGPGAVVGVAVEGRPVYRKAFGLASVELPVLLSPSMRMRIGSTTKHFTAFAFMLLCEQGKADIDDRLGKYFPELNPVTHAVTMRQLMTNTSGLREVNDLAAQFSNFHATPITTEHLLSLYRDIDDMNAPPGSTWIYNNGNWVLLTVAIERITGKSFEQAMSDLIFQPVGMLETRVRRWDFEMVPNSASTHRRSPSGVYERTEYCGGIDYAGAGAMVSTLDDMLRWLAHMDSPKVGSEWTWKLMRTAHELPNGTSTGYGLGLAIGSYRGAGIVHHAGGGFGSNVQMLKVPELSLDIMVMLNSIDSYAINRVYDILDECIDGLDPVTNAQSYATGEFLSPKTGRFIRLKTVLKQQFDMIGRSIRETEGAEQQVCMIDGIDLPFAPDHDQVLRPIGTAVYMNKSITLRGNRHEPSSLLFTDYGNVDELIRIPRSTTPDLQKIAGRYRWKQTNSDLNIVTTSAGSKMYATGRFGSNEYTLECLAERVWWATSKGDAGPPWAVLVFDENASRFEFTNACNWKLPFRRIS
jgi:CubicO group peptidase (beta-lactamase class C family)